MKPEKVYNVWKKYSGSEPLEVENIGGSFYGFTTELGALRIFYAYRNTNKNQKVGYSVNLKTWYISMEF